MSTRVAKISTGYDPRPIQRDLHLGLKRFNVIVCHRRFGKTVFSINHMIDSGLRNQRKNPRYAYLAPLYGQAKRVAWDYLKMYTENIPGATANEADLRVDIPRPALGDSVRFTLLGADNPATLKGIYLDGVILDEYAEMNPMAWREVIRPTLSDRSGWAIFIGTPKGRNSFWDIYNRACTTTDPDWFGAMYKASQTGILSASELQSAKAEMTEEEYEQEFECSFSAGLVGAYYSKQLDLAESEKRITNVPYDTSSPVTTYWDLGISDTTCIWFIQQIGREYHAIDYVEETGLGLEEYAKRLKSKPYYYAEHVLPHDAAARELGTGKTRIETLHSLGIKPTRVLERQSPNDGINAVRQIFSKVWFDAVKCKRGLEALRSYQKKYDGKAQMFSDTPLHNWASNGADAFRTFGMGVRDVTRNQTMNFPRQTESNYDIFGQ